MVDFLNRILFIIKLRGVGSLKWVHRQTIVAIIHLRHSATHLLLLAALCYLLLASSNCATRLLQIAFEALFADFLDGYRRPL